MASRSTGMNRRTALRRIGAGGLGVAAGASWVDALTLLAQSHAAHDRAAQAAVAWAPKVLDAHQLATVSTISELIIPATGTPGAKAVLVDRFVDQVLQDAKAADRASFLNGLGWMDTRSTALFNRDFVSATPEQQTDLLTRISSEGGSEDPAGTEFFTAIKSMTIAGYYTTQIGLQQELGDDGVLAQASFEGCTHPEHKMDGV